MSICKPALMISSALALIVAPIDANHTHDTFAPDDLALGANLLD
jgi:hypothetical protein